MAQSIESQQLSSSRASEPALPGLWKVRLALGWTILFAALVGLFAVSWDIQWHTAVGRDRTLRHRTCSSWEHHRHGPRGSGSSGDRDSVGATPPNACEPRDDIRRLVLQFAGGVHGWLFFS
jgi:hypothetical protein